MREQRLSNEYKQCLFSVLALGWTKKRSYADNPNPNPNPRTPLPLYTRIVSITRVCTMHNMHTLVLWICGVILLRARTLVLPSTLVLESTLESTMDTTWCIIATLEYA